MTKTINRLRFPRLRFPVPLVATLALLAILGALLLPVTAQAQSEAEVLVSNIDKTTSGFNSIRAGTGLGETLHDRRRQLTPFADQYRRKIQCSSDEHGDAYGNGEACR